MRDVAAVLPELLVGAVADAATATETRFTDAGVPADLARRVAVSDAALAALPAVALACASTASSRGRVARIQFLLDDRLGLDRVRERIAALPRADRWQTEARAALRDDFYESQHALTAAVLARDRRERRRPRRGSTPGWPSTSRRSTRYREPRRTTSSAPIRPTSPPSPSSAARSATSRRSTDVPPRKR